MAQFVIFKQDDGPAPGRPVTVIQADEAADPTELVKQGYNGPGRYIICRWDNRREFDLAPGPVEASEAAPQPRE